MIKFVESPDGTVEAVKAPYFSYSRMNRYLQCPELYRLYYIENLRVRYEPASLMFGKIIHQAMDHLFTEQGDPVAAFEKDWITAKGLDLSYAKRENWDRLLEQGKCLLGKFVREELPRIGRVEASEKLFELKITSLDVPFIGVIDLVAEVDGKKTVLDFKTSGSSYEHHQAILSDQLTAYRLAVPEADQSALCVFVKTKEPRIEWLFARHGEKELHEFLAKSELVARDIADGKFFKRPGKWCSYCDYLPVCLGDKEAVRRTLVRRD
jgi:putative RecB family exonuclease